MKIFGTQIVFEEISSSHDYILLQEKENSYKEIFPFSIEFYNNQGRFLELYSDLSFDRLSTNQKFTFVIRDVISFSWSFTNNIINYHFLEEGTQELLQYWLYHTVLPSYFSLKNQVYIFHVGAVSHKDAPLLFMAESFGGKSTLTDFFLQKGHALITDDKLLTYKQNDLFFATPSYPYHRPYREMETLGIFTENFEERQLPLKTIYLLKKVDASEKIILSKISGIEKIKHLKTCTELDFSFQFQQNMNYLFELSKTIELIQITIPWDLERLPEVYDTIINHQNSLL